MHRSTNQSPSPDYQRVTPRTIGTAEQAAEAGWLAYARADPVDTVLRTALREAVWQLEDAVDMAVGARMCLHADADGVASRCSCEESVVARAVVTVAQIVSDFPRGGARVTTATAPTWAMWLDECEVWAAGAHQKPANDRDATVPPGRVRETPSVVGPPHRHARRPRGVHA